MSKRTTQRKESSTESYEGNHEPKAFLLSRYTDRANIKLCKRPEGKKLWKYAQLTEEKLFFPEDLLEYEKQFLVN